MISFSLFSANKPCFHPPTQTDDDSTLQNSSNNTIQYRVTPSQRTARERGGKEGGREGGREREGGKGREGEREIHVRNVPSLERCPHFKGSSMRRF